MDAFMSDMSYAISLGMSYVIGISTMPLFRIGYRLITAIASLAVIYTFIIERPVARIIFAVLLVASIIVLSSCASYSKTDNGRIIQDDQLLNREICWNEREVYRHHLAKFVDCWKMDWTQLVKFDRTPPDNCDEMKEVLNSHKSKYIDCRDKQKSEQFIVNPFNLLLPYTTN